MTTLLRRVRCDTKARPYWEATPEDGRAAIVAAIPDDCYLTVVHSNDSPPFSVRLLRTTPDPGVNILVAVRRGYTVKGAALAVLAAAERAA